MSSLPQAGSPSDTEPLPRPEGGSRHFEQGSKAGPLLMQAYYRPSMTSKDAVLLDIIWSVSFTIAALCQTHIVPGCSLHSGCCVVPTKAMLWFCKQGTGWSLPLHTVAFCWSLPLHSVAFCLLPSSLYQVSFCAARSLHASFKLTSHLHGKGFAHYAVCSLRCCYTQSAHAFDVKLPCVH